MANLETVGSVLRRLRKRRGLTLQNVAHDVGYSVSIIQQWETDARPLSFDGAVIMGEYYHTDLAKTHFRDPARWELEAQMILRRMAGDIDLMNRNLSELGISAEAIANLGGE